MDADVSSGWSFLSREGASTPHPTSGEGASTPPPPLPLFSLSLLAAPVIAWSASIICNAAQPTSSITRNKDVRSIVHIYIFKDECSCLVSFARSSSVYGCPVLYIHYTHPAGKAGTHFFRFKAKLSKILTQNTLTCYKGKAGFSASFLF